MTAHGLYGAAARLDRSTLLLVVILLVLLLLLLWQSGRSRRLWRRQRKRGAAGERDAVQLLDRAGYTVVAAQHAGSFTAEVDGERWTFSLRADFLVQRRSDGRLLIAEVKTGTLAPRLQHGPTRRQLLEYTLAYQHEVSGVLLVAPEQGEVTCVSFPAVRPHMLGSRSFTRIAWLIWFGFGAAATRFGPELLKQAVRFLH